jgi:hypothetical protein
VGAGVPRGVAVRVGDCVYVGVASGDVVGAAGTEQAARSTSNRPEAARVRLRRLAALDC